MSKTKHVVIVGTGGTIASRYDSALGRTVASQGVEAILASAAKPDDLPRLTFENFSAIAGFNMTLAYADGLVRRLLELLDRPEVDGVVVTQGTDTMEETSFLAGLLIDSEKPLVFTGAQLAHDHPQSDGPRNLIDAICAAAADATKGLGAMICFNGELHGAREVTKVHTSAVETFQSYHHGALGIVDGNRVIVYRRPVIACICVPNGSTSASRYSKRRSARTARSSMPFARSGSMAWSLKASAEATSLPNSGRPSGVFAATVCRS